MRIAVLGTKGVPGRHGVEVVVDSLLPELAALGHQLTVYAYSSYACPQDDYKGGRIRTVRGIPQKNLEMITHMWSASLGTWREPYDVVHIHSTDPCLLAWLPRARNGIVATSHGQAYMRRKWSAPARGMSLVAERFFMRLPQVVTSVSKPLAAYYAEKYGREVKYIPNGIVLREKPDVGFLKEWGLEPEGFLFCSAGRMDRTKGVHVLLEAYSLLNSQLPLVIAGGGSGSDFHYLESLKRSKPDGVVFTGFLTGDALYALYAHARVFVFPSEYEAMSMALLEGLSFGTPTVYSSIPENEAFAEGLGYSFPVSDPQALARQLEEVLNRYPAALERGRKAREFIRTNHNWGTIARRYHEIYVGLR